MAFKDILGNSRVKKILKRALQKNKVPNSFLFFGPEGIGKKDMALVVAKAMNCLQKKDDACESCASCGAINNGNFPDVMVLSPQKEVLKIEQMRILKQTAYLKPMIGKRRVFVIENSEKMNTEASKSLLKILEEPPLFSHIILLTNNPYLIIPTIKSRCQILNFSPVSREDIEKVLMERGYEAEKAKIISLLVRGNLKQAMDFEWEDVQRKRQQAWQLFVSIAKKEKASSFLKDFSSSGSYDKIELDQIFEILSSFCRDLILIKDGGDVRFLMNPDYEEELRKIKNLLSFDQSVDFLKKIDYALYALKKNLNINLLISSLLSSFMEWQHV